MTKRKSKKSKATQYHHESSDSRSDEEHPAATGLIVLDEPELQVDLGDFSRVWQYLDAQTHALSLNKEAVSNDEPISRKQLQKHIFYSDDLRMAQCPESEDVSFQAPRATRFSDEVPSTEPLQISSWKQMKPKPKVPYSSAEDDGEESSWYPSSFEDKRSTLSSYRRKSFLYVPPAFISPKLPAPQLTISPFTPSASNRRRNLVQKLITKYPKETDRILAQPTAPNYLSNISISASKELHIFVDNSNILIGFFEAYKSQHGITDPFFRAPKFDFHAFTTILERGRPIAKRFLAGSNPLVQPVSLAQLLGYQVSILERVVDTNSKRAVSTASPYASDSATGPPQRERKKEQAVDEILHLKILECLLDVPTPGIIVLATGDAAPAEFSPDGGFLRCIQRALKRGWDVELVCWRKSMSRLWREKGFRLESGDKFQVIELDDYVDELVLE
jgi:hypothetical protein